nr:hypothetical protein [Tanacetum cinerariifolium]
DLKSFPQGVFGEKKPLFIQLTSVASNFLVIMDRIPELLDVNRGYGRGSCKGPEEVGVL